jgi:hypothetical protein
MTAAKSPGAVAAHGAFEIDQLGGTVISKDSPHRNFTQVGGIDHQCVGTRLPGARLCRRSPVAPVDLIEGGR